METIHECMQVYVAQCFNLLEDNSKSILEKIVQVAAVACDFNYVIDDESAATLIEKLFTNHELKSMKVIIENIVRYGRIFDSEKVIIKSYYSNQHVLNLIARYPIIEAMIYINFSQVAHLLVTMKDLTIQSNRGMTNNASKSV